MEQQLKELRDLGGGERSRPKQFYAYNITKTRLEADQAVFKVYKGVKCFDFSKDKNIIVTGGLWALSATNTGSLNLCLFVC